MKVSTFIFLPSLFDSFQINPLEAANAAKNKSKDIHLPSIDVNFGSNRILSVFIFVFSDTGSNLIPRSGASLTLAYGRRYGLIGRNGALCDTLSFATTLLLH